MSTSDYVNILVTQLTAWWTALMLARVTLMEMKLWQLIVFSSSVSLPRLGWCLTGIRFGLSTRIRSIHRTLLTKSRKRLFRVSMADRLRPIDKFGPLSCPMSVKVLVALPRQPAHTGGPVLSVRRMLHCVVRPFVRTKNVLVVVLPVFSGCTWPPG